MRSRNDKSSKESLKLKFSWKSLLIETQAKPQANYDTQYYKVEIDLAKVNSETSYLVNYSGQ